MADTINDLYYCRIHHRSALGGCPDCEPENPRIVRNAVIEIGALKSWLTDEFRDESPEFIAESWNELKEDIEKALRHVGVGRQVITSFIEWEADDEV